MNGKVNRRSFVLGAFAAMALGACLVVTAAASERARRGFAPPADLSPLELATWDQLSVQEMQLRAEARAAVDRLAAAAQAELPKPDADLRALANDAQSTADRLTSRIRALREQKLAFYDSLSGAQQAQVREQLLQRMERMQRIGRVIDAAIAE